MVNRFTYALFLLLFSIGCTVGRGSSTFPPAADLVASPPLSATDNGRDYSLLVANGLGETLSLIERSSGVWTVTPDILSTGQASNQIAVRSDKCYIVNSLSNAIQIVDIPSLTTLGEISTGPATNPVFMDFINNSTAVVSCYLSNEVLIVDLSLDTPPSNRIIARIPMPSTDSWPRDPGHSTNSRPGGICVVDNKCYVVCANLSMVHVAGGPGVLVEIDIPSRQITGIHFLSGRDTTGILHSDRFPSRLIIISAGTYALTQGFIGDGTIESYDIDTGDIFQVVKVDGAPFEGAVGTDDILICENAKEGKLLRIDLHEGVALPDFPLPSYGLALSYASSVLPLPGLLCVTDFNADRLYLVAPDSGDILAELATGDGPDAIAALDPAE
jgi:hypothetical protein